MKIKVVLEPSDEGGYTVYVPSLPGCITEGETLEEALLNIQEAIELYLEPLEVGEKETQRAFFVSTRRRYDSTVRCASGF